MTPRRRLFRIVLVLAVAPILSCAMPPVPSPELGWQPIPSPDYTQAHRYLESQARRLGPDEIHELARTIVFESRQAGLEVGLVLAVIQVESSGNPGAVSHVGAMGLMQLLPGTAVAVAKRAGVDWQGPETLFDGVANVRMGIVYLAQLVDRFGDVDTALIAYNWGPTRIARIIRRGRVLPVRYSERVNQVYQSFS